MINIADYISNTLSLLPPGILTSLFIFFIFSSLLLLVFLLFKIFFDFLLCIFNNFKNNYQP